MLNKQLHIYEDFFYDYQIEKIMNLLQYEPVLKKLFKLESIEDIINAYNYVLENGVVICN